MSDLHTNSALIDFVRCKKDSWQKSLVQTANSQPMPMIFILFIYLFYLFRIYSNLEKTSCGVFRIISFHSPVSVFSRQMYLLVLFGSITQCSFGAALMWRELGRQWVIRTAALWNYTHRRLFLSNNSQWCIYCLFQLRKERKAKLLSQGKSDGKITSVLEGLFHCGALSRSST